MNRSKLKDISSDPARSVRTSLHPLAYATLIGLVLWFVMWIWSFASAGMTDYLLVIVSGFFLVVIVLVFVLSRVGYRNPMTDDKPELFHDWATSDLDTYAGRLSGLQAATLILLPIAAAAFGMMAFGVAFLVVEHGGV